MAQSDKDKWVALLRGDSLRQFVEIINPDVIIPSLRAREALMPAEIELIRHERTREAQVLALLDFLQRRPTSYEAFRSVCFERRLCEDLFPKNATGAQSSCGNSSQTNALHNPSGGVANISTAPPHSTMRRGAIRDLLDRSRDLLIEKLDVEGIVCRMPGLPSTSILHSPRPDMRVAKLLEEIYRDDLEGDFANTLFKLQKKLYDRIFA